MKSFRHFSPAKLKHPIFVSTPHVGLEIHPLRPELKTLSKECLLRDIDYEVHQMWEPTCRKLGIGWMGANFHRYNLDLNRKPTLNSDFVKIHSTPGTGEKKGLFWKESTLGEDLGFRPLELKQAEQLIADLWQPYYQHIAENLAAIKAQFGYALLIDAHSMPSRGEVNHSDKGAQRADVVPGNLDSKTCPAVVNQILSETCAQHSLSCAFNTPYKGGNITQHFWDEKNKIFTLQIEINRACYMNESTKELNSAGVKRLEKFSTAFIEKIISIWKG